MKKKREYKIILYLVLLYINYAQEDGEGVRRLTNLYAVQEHTN